MQAAEKLLKLLLAIFIQRGVRHTRDREQGRKRDEESHRWRETGESVTFL